MQPVNVLLRVHRQQYLLLVEPGRQRKLHQIGVDLGIGIEPVHGGDKLGLGDIGGQVLVGRVNPDFGAVGVLHGHVPRARAIVPHQNGPQPYGHSGAGQAGDTIGDFGPDPGGQEFPIEQGGGHRRLLSAGSGVRHRP